MSTLAAALLWLLTSSGVATETTCDALGRAAPPETCDTPTKTARPTDRINNGV